MSLFPIIQPETTAIETEFPLFREVRWNYKEDKPVFQNGEPQIVEGNEAILVWIWNGPPYCQAPPRNLYMGLWE